MHPYQSDSQPYCSQLNSELFTKDHRKMAVKPCPECGAMISEFARKCPKCGVVLNNATHTNENSENTNNENTNSENYSAFDDRHHKRLLWCLVAVVIGAIIAVGCVLFLKDNDKRATEEIDGTINITDSIATPAAVVPEDVKITEEYKQKLAEYLIIEPYSDSMSRVVTQSGRCGYIDENGDLVIPAIYDYWNSRDFSDNVAYVEKAGSHFFIDRKGTTFLSLKKDEICSDFVNGRAAIYTGRLKENADGEITAVLGRNVRIINKNGETLCEIPLNPQAKVIDDGMGALSLAPLHVDEDCVYVPTSDFHYYRYDFQGHYLGKTTTFNKAVNIENFKYIVFTEKKVLNEDRTEDWYGIKDKNGNIIVEAKPWNFPTAKFDENARQLVINPTNGVFLAYMYEYFGVLDNVDQNHVEVESDAATYYGFVDLLGKDSFTKKRWDRQKKQTQIFKAQNSNYN